MVGMTEKERVMEKIREYGLTITVEGGPGRGKTIAARAIRTLLEGMGAWACVKDEGEIIWAHTDPTKMPPRGPDYLLGDTSVLITTKYPE
jgi:type IV secretory pathway ATPase VirB11/archaellum biosynthesis ATPase